MYILYDGTNIHVVSTREQSFNCGHDGIPLDLAARFVAWSSNPMMVYFAQSGSINPKCPEKQYNPPYSSEV
jgi:hypothetical protein